VVVVVVCLGGRCCRVETTNVLMHMWSAQSSAIDTPNQSKAAVLFFLWPPSHDWGGGVEDMAGTAPKTYKKKANTCSTAERMMPITAYILEALPAPICRLKRLSGSFEGKAV
jgi:hypothetical protein